MSWGLHRRLGRVGVMAALLLALFGGLAGPLAPAESAGDPRCEGGPLFLFNTRAGGTKNPVAKPTVPGGLPVTPPPEAQGAIDLAWGRNVSEPGAPSFNTFHRYCNVNDQAKAQGQTLPTPADPRIVEPGTQFSVAYHKHFGPEQWAVTVKFVGSGLAYNKTITANQSCFIVCGAYETTWQDLVIPPTATGYFELSVRTPTGAVDRRCVRTVTGVCPF